MKVIYDENTIFNANINLLCPKWVDVTFETSGSPSCWTDYGPTRYNGAKWQSILSGVRKDCLRQEEYKNINYGANYYLEVVLIF